MTMDRESLADDDLVRSSLDPPAVQRVQRRGAQGGARAQAEAGVVEGAAHGVPDEQAVGECGVIMRAEAIDGEYFLGLARHQDSLIANAPHEHRAIRKVIQRNAAFQIGAWRWVVHGLLLAQLRDLRRSVSHSSADLQVTGVLCLQKNRALQSRALGRSIHVRGKGCAHDTKT
jgi:hypothetical protein